MPWARRGKKRVPSTLSREPVMLLVREVMYCEPGKVRPLVEKVKAMSKLMEKSGMGKMRMLTDVCTERY